MVKRSIFKRSIVSLVIMMMLLSCVNPLQFTYADDEQVVVGTRRSTVEEHLSHGEAEEGFAFVCEHTERVYNRESSICGKDEHTHSAYAGECYTQNLCESTEHVHSDDCYEQTLVCDIPENHQHNDACYERKICNKDQHIHNIKCFWGVFCGKDEHTHSEEEGGCRALELKCTTEANHVHAIGSCIQLSDEPICGTEEHTHSSNSEDDCQGWELTCTGEEHIHDDSCYPFEEEYYTCSLVRTGTGVEQGNARITVTVTVLDARNNTPIPGAIVNLILHKYFVGNKTFNPGTDASGVATAKVDSTYDRVISYSVEAQGYKWASASPNDGIGTGWLNPTERHYTIKLAPEVYTVKFYDAENNLISEQSVEYKASATAPANPVKEGSTFKGWDSGAWKAVTENLEVRPVFELAKYKVTFDLNGGNINGNTNDIVEEVTYGNTVSELTNAPSIQDAIFNGWYLDEEGTEPFDFETIITSDITLFANYLENGKANLYVLKPEQERPYEETGDQRDYSSSNYINVGSAKFSKSFKAEEFAETSADAFAVERLLSEKTANSAVNDGIITMKFNGYVWTASFDTVDWYVIKTKYNPGNIDGEAIWTKGDAANYNIEYILNAEDAMNPVSNTDTFTVNDEVILYDAQRANYKFEGWYTRSDFSEASKVTGFEKGTIGDQRVYAKWSINTDTRLSVYHYYVPADYVLDDATNPYIIVDNTIRLNHEEILAKFEKIEDGYLLRKGNPIQVWGYKNINGQTQAPEEIELLDGEYNVEGCTDVRVHIAYDLVQYNIEYVLNSTDATNQNISKFTIKDGVLLNDPSRPDYIFEGWYTRSDFADDSKVIGFKKGTMGDQKVYAKWSLKTYTVSIEYKYADGVQGDVNDLPKNVLDTYNIGSNYKYDVKKIYGFTASNETIEGIDIRSNQEYVITYSDEETQEITVDFYKDLNSTIPIASERVKLFASELDNENIEDLIIERIGGIDAYRPEGYESGKKTYFAEDYYMEIVYIAQYNVIYDVNGGKEIILDTNKYAEGEKIIILSSRVTRDGFEFKGWLSSENGNLYQANSEIFMGKNDIILTAQWEAIQTENPYPEQPEYEDPIVDIEDDQIPGDEIPNNDENNSDIDLPDEAVPGGAIPENNEDDNINLIDEEIPGGAATLPNTAGVTAEILYGLGALALISGIGFKRKNK